LKIPRETKDKLTRFFLNSDPFMFGVLRARNKKGRIQELKALGLLKGYAERFNPAYSRINQDLLVELGIEGILQRIVVPRVKELFPQVVLDYFRRCWEQGQTPTLDYLKKHGMYHKHPFTDVEVHEGWDVGRAVGYKEPAFVFVQIQVQHNFVERWTVFAGLWFEEIEPLIASTAGSSSEVKA
jgi:hypothetical protein